MDFFGLSIGELISRPRLQLVPGAYQGDAVPRVHGCGQLNAFEVINDNDTSGTYKNLGALQLAVFVYGGGSRRPPRHQAPGDRPHSTAPSIWSRRSPGGRGALASQTPRMNPSAFFRRPSAGFRYFRILFDVESRAVTGGGGAPQSVPEPPSPPLCRPSPVRLSRAVIDALLQLRLPR